MRGEIKKRCKVARRVKANDGRQMGVKQGIICITLIGL
jgi:hypothetical protein